eukprot:1138526-Pelagomonas_calceolata.AAC.4
MVESPSGKGSFFPAEMIPQGRQFHNNKFLWEQRKKHLGKEGDIRGSKVCSKVEAQESKALSDAVP